MSKYHNKKVKIDGEIFDSLGEYKRYCELKLLERAGIIRNLERQVKFILTPTIKGKDGKVMMRESSYIADFVYYDEDGKYTIEDFKGMKTDVYKLKKKLIFEKYQILIKETK